MRQGESRRSCTSYFANSASARSLWRTPVPTAPWHFPPSLAHRLKCWTRRRRSCIRIRGIPKRKSADYSSSSARGTSRHAHRHPSEQTQPPCAAPRQPPAVTMARGAAPIRKTLGWITASSVAEVKATERGFRASGRSFRPGHPLSERQWRDSACHCLHRSLMSMLEV